VTLSDWNAASQIPVTNLRLSNAVEEFKNLKKFSVAPSQLVELTFSDEHFVNAQDIFTRFMSGTAIKFLRIEDSSFSVESALAFGKFLGGSKSLDSLVLIGTHLSDQGWHFVSQGLVQSSSIKSLLWGSMTASDSIGRMRELTTVLASNKLRSFSYTDPFMPSSTKGVSQFISQGLGYATALEELGLFLSIERHVLDLAKAI
jgi:hypothetical protein